MADEGDMTMPTTACSFWDASRIDVEMDRAGMPDIWPRRGRMTNILCMLEGNVGYTLAREATYS